MKSLGKFILSTIVIVNVLTWIGYIISLILVSKEVSVNWVNFDTLKTVFLSVGIFSTCALTTALGVRALSSSKRR